MQIRLAAEDQRIIEAKLRTGHYQSIDEVVHAALGLLEMTPDSADELRTLLDEGIRELDCGKGMPLDIESIKREGRARLG